MHCYTYMPCVCVCVCGGNDSPQVKIQGYARSRLKLQYQPSRFYLLIPALHWSICSYVQKYDERVNWCDCVNVPDWMCVCVCACNRVSFLRFIVMESIFDEFVISQRWNCLRDRQSVVCFLFVFLFVLWIFLQLFHGISINLHYNSSILSLSVSFRFHLLLGVSNTQYSAIFHTKLTTTNSND